MRTLHCDIYENAVTCFADDLAPDHDDDGVDIMFADHDVDCFEYCDTSEDDISC